MSNDTENRLLRALHLDDRRAVLDACDRIHLEAGAVLARVGEPMTAAHFPERAVISALATYADGSTIEMANIGREACTGVGLALGAPRQLVTLQVQIAGAALVLSDEAFERLSRERPEVEAIFRASVQALFHQVMVSGACNGAHGTRQRLARWLLTMHDRNDGETMRLTQDFLAEMLGLRRATVTRAASELQAEGLIDYARGRIAVTDAEGLRGASCECYDLVRSAYETLLPERP